jgi:hypothetical protein
MQELRDNGVDPEQLVQQVGEIATHFHEHPSEFGLTKEELAESENLAREQEKRIGQTK